MNQEKGSLSSFFLGSIMAFGRLVKWYNRGLQNLSWGFDSLIAREINKKRKSVFYYSRERKSDHRNMEFAGPTDYKEIVTESGL